jgi:sugar O-acyltransferase (sialic acid O-acetyltransferase NeuD family)
MTTLAILGASGHGKVVADAALASGLWDKVTFYDDAWPVKTKNGVSDIVGSSATLLDLKDKPEVIVAIGNNNVRLAKQNELVAKGFTMAIVMHPAATVSASASVEPGTVIFAGAVINAEVKIGPACIINSNAVVEHDCELAAAVHISPGACLAGGVVVGQCSWLGIGAVVIQLKHVGKNVMIGAGAAVIEDLPDNVTAVGAPARIIKS